MKKILSVIAALALVGVAGCTKSEEADTTAQVSAVAVAAVPAKRGTMTSSMAFDGNLKAQSEVIVTIPQPGKVISSNVGVGSVVKKGQLLFSMDPKDVTSQKATTKAQYDAAKASADYTNTMISDSEKQLANSKKAKSDLETQMKNMIDPISKALTGNKAQASIVAKLKAGNYSAAVKEMKAAGIQNPLFNTFENLLLSKEQLDSAIIQLEGSLKSLKGQQIQAQGQVDVAKAGLKAIEAQINNYKVYAPISGIVSTYDITVGSYPVSQVPLTIVDMDKVTLTVNMLDTQIGKIKVGDSVDIAVEAMNNQKVVGRIKSIAPSPDIQTRMYPVIVEIENPDHSIKPGYFVKASFATGQNENALYIPSAGLLKNDDGSAYVYLNVNGMAKMTPVEIGIYDTQGNVEIVSGINEGDLVITSNLSSIRDNAPVFSLEEKED